MFSVFSYDTNNLGDDIQSIATELLIEEQLRYILRDSMSLAKNGPKSTLIANGWYMHGTDFPPPPNITPIYTSICIADNRILNNNLNHFKNYAPIGCRDAHTLNMFISKKIEAYYSGCMTLTLPNTNKARTNNVYLVDIQNIKKLPRQLQNCKRLSHWCHAQTPYIKRKALALSLLKRYQLASLVITSRLHCALPCIAYGTPVILIPHVQDRWRFEPASRYIPIYSPNDKINWNPKPVIYNKTLITQQFIKTIMENR